jgi:AraC family transcriptional regulator, regulatory protein of adaptative response / methylated-DNA-[protein]-cysteine methyltransferase
MMGSDYEQIKKAIDYVRENASRQPSLDEIALTVGLSPSYFQRVFRRWAGVSPKRLLQYLNAAEAKRLLRASTPVLDAAFAVGLSGPSRLHDLIVSTEAVTPGEYAELGDGLRIRYGWHDSPFGRCLIAITERGVCALRFAAESGGEQDLAQVKTEWEQARWIQDQHATSEVFNRIFAVTSPRHVLLHLKGTNFQLKVWEALLRIPEHSVISYADLANRIGSPNATRAVAKAVGANPVAFLIPCHRVLRSSGELGGYRWGLDRKAVMLARELVRSTNAVDPGRLLEQDM